MSVSPTRLLSAALVALIAAASPAYAQFRGSSSDRGKDKIAKLFRPAIADAGESTVRVQCNGKDVALGTVVGADGLILTKGSELRGEITCKMADGASYDAKYVGYHKETDLALLRVDANDLKPVKFADASEATVGNWVAAPGTMMNGVMGVGVVSVKVRKLLRDTDEGMIENANKGYLGVFLDKSESGIGALIRDIPSSTSAAAKARLKANDLICEVDGKNIENKDKLIELLEGYRPGDKIKVRVKRGEKELSVDVTLGSRSDINRGDFQNTMGGSLSGRRTGFPAVIQHDTVLRTTDCGGPLVDLEGNVLGINIARAGRVETWALPPDVISTALKDLKSGKLPPPGQ